MTAENAPETATPPAAGRDPWLAGFRLGDWQVDVSGNRLLRGSEIRPLRHKAMELLLLLARHAGRTVSRDEIIDAVWAGNRFVAPKAINTAVWTIRQALGDDPDSPRYLETIAKKGYRLIAPVTRLAEANASESSEPAGATSAASPSITPQGRRMPLGWLATGGLAVALAIAAALTFQPRQPHGADAAPPGGSASAADPAGAAASARPEVLTQEPGVEYLGALSPDGRALAFAWWRGRGDGGLFLRRSGTPGDAPEPLATARGDVSGLAWIGDGRGLAFTALRDNGRCGLWVQPVPAEAGAPVPPPREIARCAFLNTPALAVSPDGRQIVFAAEQDGAGGLFVIAPDGTGLRRLTTAAPAAMADHQPSWSPDGSRIAFVRQDPADGSRDLHEVSPGSEPVRLTTLKLQFVHGLAHGGNGRDLVFSTTQQDARVLLRWQRDGGRVVPLGLEGSAPARAADGSLVYALMRSHISVARAPFRGTPVRVLQAVASDRMPQPDPAGRRLAFVSRRGGTPELWLAATDGSDARALTALGGIVEWPSWSARGDRLAFIGPCGPGRRVGLCAVRDDGTGMQPLATDAARYGAPAWHPQRDEIWVTSDRGGAWQVWRFGAAGGAGTAEPTDRPPGRNLQWLPDGSGFVYQPLGERHLRWRPLSGLQAGKERRVDVTTPGEELVDWRLGADGITTLTRSDRDRWRRVDLASGRHQALGDHALGSFPEHARFAPAGRDAVWVEVANTQVADLMRLR